MFKSLMTTIVSGLLTATALAQPAAQTMSTAAQPPFVGLIASNDVYVRCGASQNYYPVGKLNAGDTVNVVELTYGWYGIQPPAGSYSLISQQYVKLEADGATGTVTGEDVRVRAPSPAGPGQSYKIQMKLDTGAKVAVLGTEAEFYKIVPPAGALLYVNQEFLTPVTTGQPAAESTAPTDAPAAETVVAAPVEPPSNVVPEAEASANTSTSESAPPQVVTVVEVISIPVAAQPKNYNSVGKLLASTIYTGGEMQLLYRLVDSQTGLTIAYIQPPDPYIMLPLLGKFVGIVGDSRYDPGMKLPIIRAKEFDALGPTS